MKDQLRIFAMMLKRLGHDPTRSLVDPAEVGRTRQRLVVDSHCCLGLGPEPIKERCYHFLGVVAD